MSKNKNKTNVQKIKDKILGQKGGEVPLYDVITNLKEQILEEVKLCSTGVKVTVYDLFEMGKELAELENQMLTVEGDKAQPNAEDF